MGRKQSTPSALQQALPEVAFIDVEAELAAIGHVPNYSDGMHLVAPSAQAAAKVLETAVAKYDLVRDASAK